MSHNSAQRLRRLYDLLFAAYGPQAWWPAKTSFEVIVGAYLTQNTSWKAVERSLNALRTANALTPAGLLALSIEDLQQLIRPSGFITRKAPALKAFVTFLDAQFGSSLDTMATVPTDILRRQLLALPGVGPETADAILLYALGHEIPVADEYLRRIVERHGLRKSPIPRNHLAYETLSELTRQAFASDPHEKHVQLFNEFHALTVAVGKAHCGSTPNCEKCPLRSDLVNPILILSK